MSTLVLTSYERLRRYIADTNDGALSTSTALKFQLDQWARAVSAKIEKFLNRELHIEERTQYWDTRSNVVEYPVPATPITSITDVYEDTTAQWTAPTIMATTDYRVNVQENAVLFEVPRPAYRKSLRARYLGGIAYSGTRSVYAVTYASGLFTVGNYVQGTTSDAMGIVRASATGTVTIEVLRAGFEVDETLTEYTDEDATTASGETATITAATSLAAVETYPDIVAACEVECRYMWKHKDTFEASSTNRDGTSIRRESTTAGLMLTKEAVNLLMPHRRHYIVP